jgi:Sap, sulfolipid-1-addressing protein
MWVSFFASAFLLSIHPMRLGVTLLVISRPQPMQNLLAYWIGCALTGSLVLTVPLMLLHATPAFASSMKVWANPAANSTARHLEICMGVLMLSIAALMGVRFMVRQRARPRGRNLAQLQTPGDNTSTLVQNPSTPPAISWLLGPAQDPATEGGSAIQRLATYVRDAWENGSLWVAFVIGLALGPSLDAVGILFTLTFIVASGAGIGIQVIAGIAFLFAVLAVEEIILVGNLVSPDKTQPAVRRLHDWALAHRRKLLIATLIVAGVSLVAQGMGASGVVVH